MTCVDCKVHYIHLEFESTRVCPQCGLTKKIGPVVTPTGFGENVFVCVYSRAKRFEVMLKALLFPSFDKKDTVMYQHLVKSNKKFESILALQNCMKLCNTKEKRFHSLHLFASLFCANYVPIAPPTQQFFKRVKMIFDEVLCRFNATVRTQFFSYPWLLRTLLNLIGEVRYDKYVKTIRCKKRNKYYVDLFRGLVRTAPKTYFISECDMNKCGWAT